MLLNQFPSKPISDVYFAPILDLFFKCSDCFSLTLHDFYLMKSDVLFSLNPFKLCSFSTTDWFCYHTTKENPLTIIVYKSNDKAKDILLQYYRNIYLNTSTDLDICAQQNLEDICFFQNGKLILGTVSHELICHVYPPSVKIEETLQAMCDGWISREGGNVINLWEYMEQIQSDLT